MIYYAITVSPDHIVTGVHACATPFLSDHFRHSEDFKNDSIIPVESEIDGIVGLPLEALNEDYTPKPLIWLIRNGYADVPEGFELIGDELVPVSIPVENLPPTLRETLDSIQADSAERLKATKIVFQALAKTDAIPVEDMLDNLSMFSDWSENIGKRADELTYWRYNGVLYRVNAGQGHTIQADWAPDVAVSLFSRASDPTEEWTEWIQPTGSHNAYPINAKCSHNGKRWINELDNNPYEPGIYGWKEVPL